MADTDTTAAGRKMRSNSISSDSSKQKSSDKTQNSMDKTQNSMDKICQMLKQLQQTVDTNQKSTNDRLNSLELKLSTHLKETDTKYKSLAAEVCTIKEVVYDKFENLERQYRLNDILIRGIPVSGDENLFHIYDQLAKILKFPYEKMYVLSSIFRLNFFTDAAIGGASSERQLPPPPILVKFATPFMRRAFFNQYLKFNNLKLSDIGMKSSARIYICDNLTKKNSLIYKKAVQMKSENLIEKLQVRNGFVHVKYPGASVQRRIRHMRELSAPVESQSIPESSIDLNTTIIQSE